MFPKSAYRLLVLTLPLAMTSCFLPPQIYLDGPIHGTFTNATSVNVHGRLEWPEVFVSLAVNGVSVPIGSDFSTDVALDAAEVFNRITVEGVLQSGETLRESVVLIVGDGVTTGFTPDGNHDADAVALRISDTGLGQISPIVESLSSDALDISDLITGQNPIATGSFVGISYTANAVDVGFGGFGLGVDAAVGGLDTDIQIDDFFIEVDLDLGFLGTCTLEIETTTTNITGTLGLQPLAADPQFVDVNLTSPVGVTLSGFNSTFVSGVCDDPLIGDIIGLIIGDAQLQDLMETGFEDNLADPDGAGPLDSPLAAAIETSLAGISIAGPIGAALGGTVDAPISTVDEDVDGITILADAAIFSDAPLPEAPDFPASYAVTEAVPTFGTLTPVGSLPYGMAFGISTSGMNQLLKTQIENGLLRSEFSEFLGQPLTTGLLSQFLISLNFFPPSTPVEIRIRPTIAPVFTGAMGPGGEFAEMKIAGLQVEFWLAQGPFLVIDVDLDAGIDLVFTPAGLEFALATPASQDIRITVTDNPFDFSDLLLTATFQTLFPLFSGELEDAIDAFPIPAFLGLDLEPVEVARLPGGMIGLFANLTQTPTTHIENVVFTDLSTGDFRQSGGCWLREWRHRLSGSAFGNTIDTNMKGMLGADAGCTTNDASSTASMTYRVNFDVVSVAGEQWTLDIDHSLLGALDRISDGYNDGFGFQDGGGTATITSNALGSWSVGPGDTGTIDFTPSVTQISDGIGGGSNDEDVEFSGSNGVSLVRTGNASVQIDFQVDLDAFSNSNTWFPTANGDEMAIRLGKNDTIDNNFTAGSYPGMGSRNIADDGHMATIVLTSQPLP